MHLQFSKYQGAGNDFVLIDNRSGVLKNPTQDTVAFLCDRRFGIGADGLMLLEKADGYDFRMVYYNSDGLESTMCGNGGRCITAFAKQIGAIDKYAKFFAIDGEHEAEVMENGEVDLKMIDIQGVEHIGDDRFMDTGSPHYVRFVDDIHRLDVFAEGQKIRYNERFKAEGTNVNFVSIQSDHIEVATYERGVEDETLACGTGVVASSIATAIRTDLKQNQFSIKTKGGQLRVRFDIVDGQGFRDVWLRGAATFVFAGVVEL